MSRRGRRVSGSGRRRTVSVTVVVVFAICASALLPLAVALLGLVDLVRLRPRLPLARLFLFGLCWAWLEVLGVAAAAGLWLMRRAGDVGAHYSLQAWWADKLMASLRITCGLTPEVSGVDRIRPGPTVLLVRHASLADSLLTAWVITARAGLRPRIVMKRELLVDPCLDIVGNRLPNCFVDRSAADSGPELRSIAEMAVGLDTGDVAVLFPEGTRVNTAKRRRSLDSIARSDADRAARLEDLQHLLPPRPGGAAALLAAAPEAELCVGWHVGFEGLDTFPGIIAALGRRRTPVRMRFERLARPGAASADGGSGDMGFRGGAAGSEAEFLRWLDGVWLELDREVDHLLSTGGGR